MKINLKNLKNFKKGVSELTPEQQLDIKITASIGTLVGFAMAFISLVVKVFYMKFDWASLGFTIVLFFALVLTYVQYIAAKQQKKQLEILRNQMSNLNNNKTGDELW